MSPHSTLPLLKCHCLTTITPHTFTPCGPTSPSQPPPAFDWATAQTLASTHALKIQLASDATISSLLSADLPLPTSVLMRMGDGAHMPLEDGWRGDGPGAQRIVCGFGDEVERLWRTGDEDRGGDGIGNGNGYRNGNDNGNEGFGDEACWVRFLWHAMLMVVLLAVVYASAEGVWKRIQRRFSARPAPRGIRLLGEEKMLAAGVMQPELGETSDFDSPVRMYSQPPWDRRRHV